MKTTHEWWTETKADEQKLNHWLRRQYVGEMAAVNLLSHLLIRFGYQMSDREWENVHKVMTQEAVHARWVKHLLDARGLKPEPEASAERKYWNEVVPAVDSFAKGAAAGYHAEQMRLIRIREIAQDMDAPRDIRETFVKILPHEEWHEEVFSEMMGKTDITEFHERGLEALNLTLA
jgi:rubrerythrin